MPKLPPIPSFVTTSLMFAVLCLMLWMSRHKNPGVIPYDEIDSCLVRNIERQKELNKNLVKEIINIERYDEGIMKLKKERTEKVHSNTLNTEKTLKKLLVAISKEDTSKNIYDSILNTILHYHNFCLTMVRPENRWDISSHSLIKPEYLDGIIVLMKKVNLGEKETLVYAIINNIFLFEEPILNAIFRNFEGFYCGFGGDFPVSIPDKGWYYTHEKVTAKIITLVNYQKTVNPVITSRTGRIKSVEYGLATWEDSTYILGYHKVNGMATSEIRYSDRSKNETVTRPWSFQYMVLAPGTSLSLNKMQVLYAGIPTTVMLSAPGYSAEKLTLRVPGASVKQRGKGQFEITTEKKTKKLWAYLDAANEEGNITTLEAVELKVIPPPPPVIHINGYAAGTLPASTLQHHLQLAAKHADDDYNTGYTIQSFEYTLLQYHKKTATEPVQVQGAVLPLITEATAGDRLIISGIQSSDAYGNTYQPLTVSFILQ
jgi:hypothetical protein